jgi:stage II sporulation protein AA (anti-sigma F factor antagonist)
MSKNNCKLQISCADGVMVASLDGELDHHGAVAVRTLIDAEIRRLSPQKTVLDLSSLDFMDSSGLGLIMGRYTLMQKMGGEFCVRNPNERIVKIFRLAGLERMVRVENEGKEALK